jgi:pimeloyl-ACP methyl ester carboxylesterase
VSKVSIPLLVETAWAVLRELEIERFHLVGHSMGGLTALLLAGEESSPVLSFIDIEGNLAPEDCFLSRQVITHPADNPSASSTTSSHEPAGRRHSPARSTRQAFATRCARALSAGSSSPWSSSPITAT